jgi:quinohemoprotein ethanol dehydrogenase
MHVDKNGFFYVLDRTDGKVLLAKPAVRVTWAKWGRTQWTSPTNT